MPVPISHHLIDPAIHRAVEEDHQAREAGYRTVYDDDTEGTTIHMLYWNEQDGEVQSCPIEDWATVGASGAVR